MVDSSQLIEIAKESLMLVLTLSAAPVLTALVVGLIVSLMQATTQVQEQTLTFVPKLVGIVLVLILLTPVGMQKIVGFTSKVFLQFIK